MNGVTSNELFLNYAVSRERVLGSLLYIRDVFNFDIDRQIYTCSDDTCLMFSNDSRDELNHPAGQEKLSNIWFGIPTIANRTILRQTCARGAFSSVDRCFIIILQMSIKFKTFFSLTNEVIYQLVYLSLLHALQFIII